MSVLDSLHSGYVQFNKKDTFSHLKLRFICLGNPGPPGSAGPPGPLGTVIISPGIVSTGPPLFSPAAATNAFSSGVSPNAVGVSVNGVFLASNTGKYFKLTTRMKPNLKHRIWISLRIPEVKLVKNPLLFLHQSTFTMQTKDIQHKSIVKLV